MNEPRTCIGCIRERTSADDRYCAHCSHIFATASNKPDDRFAARGGEWVRGPGGVRTWTGSKASDDHVPPPMVNECGTDAGYREHTRKRRERACKDCLSAHAVAERLRAADRRIANLRAAAEMEIRRDVA